jgi:2-polyprenyl-3-methyl-5-hydroxy-6-metoxy-1,4-benzoquinol methylase
VTCCARSAGRIFSKKQARRDARRYRRRGLDATAQRMVDQLGGRGIGGATVLEVGGGIGAIEIELLRAGAARTTNVELSDGYEDEARTLLSAASLDGRAERRLGDFVEQAEGLEPADVVVMHRVVCCYPDEEALVGAAADRARRLLALSFPRDTRVTRTGVSVLNLVLRAAFDFRMYVRPAQAVLAPARARGFRVVHEHEGVFWRLAVLER